jgi:hypothetical protein
MDRNELFALKLQMGINPSTQIEPGMLRAMWQQLKLERANAQRNNSGTARQPGFVTTTPMFI